MLLRLSENGGYLLSHKRSTIGDAELNDPVPSPLSALSPASARSAVSRLCPLRSLQPLSAQLFSALSPAPARRRRAQPTPRMAHTAPHSATPPPMRQTRGGKRRLFLPGQKRYGLSQKRSIGLSFFERPQGARE